jgi:hypothetical protein
MLLFTWRKLRAQERWLLAAVPLLLLIFEFVTIGWREPTLEKIWSAIFAVGIVSFWPLVLRQRGWLYRVVAVLLVAVIGLSLVDWWRVNVLFFGYTQYISRIEGDGVLYSDPQEHRILEVADRLKNQTILCGQMNWGYCLSPAVANFTANQCLTGWTYPEELAGHGPEAHAREDFADSFYAGHMADPLPYLSAHNVAAVLIWPENKISDEILAQMQKALAPDYVYIDCKQDGPNNAGLFLRK